MQSERVRIEDSLKSLAEVEASGPPVRYLDKNEAKRTELAKAALETLAELGFARTSLRDIAKNTDYSHGVLHYYFKDKVDLITCSVQDYKSICATRYDNLVATAQTEEVFLKGFGQITLNSLIREAPLHRLWYDLRIQSMFSDAYRSNIQSIDALLSQMVWHVYVRFCGFSGIQPRQSEARVYALFDGVFQSAVLNLLSEGETSDIDFEQEMIRLLTDIRSLENKATSSN